MKAILFAAALTLAGAASAAPVFMPSLTNISGPDSSGVYTYAYSISFKNVANKFAVNPGVFLDPPGQQGSADFLTIYDIPSFVDATVNPLFPEYAIFSIGPIGKDGPGTSPMDDKTLPNVTIRYIGNGETNDFTDTDAILIRSLAGQAATGTYTSQYTINAAPNNEVGEIGAVDIPSLGTLVVPEPSSLMLVALGLFGVAGAAGCRRLRIRSAA